MKIPDIETNKRQAKNNMMPDLCSNNVGVKENILTDCMSISFLLASFLCLLMSSLISSSSMVFSFSTSASCSSAMPRASDSLSALVWASCSCALSVSLEDVRNQNNIVPTCWWVSFNTEPI